MFKLDLEPVSGEKFSGKTGEFGKKKEILVWIQGERVRERRKEKCVCDWECENKIGMSACVIESVRTRLVWVRVGVRDSGTAPAKRLLQPIFPSGENA